ncbi:lipase [Kibdelosporangium persicum]|uniref:Platelet-activating factor acetylhydrolase n=1 Tax=Kibdelosporangium persicum TaxID=2698649 RepID=A0ABX2F073_9PSEU|nr:lipase [Kibdelosporangium persicum]NRN64623.1 Platelet-activating factor acetylhydrolase [Kibdelosporangium persicum]
MSGADAIAMLARMAKKNWRKAVVPALCVGMLAVTGLISTAAASPTAHPSPLPIKMSLPRPTGPYSVGTADLHLVDHDRTDPWASPPGQPRELMVSLWYPARPAPDRPTRHLTSGVAAFYDQNSGSVGLNPGVADFAGTRTHARARAAAGPGDRPVVLYSPGGGQSRAFGTTLVEDLASRGFVVVTVDHTFAGPVQFPDRMELPASGVDMAQMMRERAQDTSFVLDQLGVIAAGGNPDTARRPLPTGIGAALDLSRIGMFGHSMGGFTTAETMLTDRRIDAGANLDGSMDPRSGEASARGADRPFLLMGGGTSGRDDQPHNHQYAPDWASFWANSTGWKRDLYLPAAEHASFTDAQVLLPQIDRKESLPAEKLAGAIGTVDPGRSLAAQRDYLAAFFGLHLRGQQTNLFDSDSPAHPDVRLVP